MKKIKIVLCLLLGLFLSLNLSAQTQMKNVLRIPDVTAVHGKTSVLPVYLDNTNDVVGVQFTMVVPTGMTLETGEVELGARAEDHVANIRKVEANSYLCMVYSPTNKPLRGYTGKLFDVSFTITETFVDGSTHPLELTDVVLGNAEADNVMTSHSIGNLLVAKGPDLMIQNVVVTEDVVVPSGIMNVSWVVVNDSERPTASGWKEQVSLVKDDGSQVLVGTVFNDAILAGNGQMVRSASMKLPQIMGLDGTAKVQVKVIANTDAGESPSAAANNTSVSSKTVNVGKKLFIELPQVGIEENNTSLIKCKLSRSGNWAAEETYTLSKSNDDRVDLPSLLTIPKGQSAAYFYVRLIDNEVIDKDSVITINALGNGYDAVDGLLIVVDNEYPDLTITVPKYEVAEGENFQLSIEAGRVSSKPVTLYITCDRPEHFKYPAQVILPAGATSVEVNVTAMEDNLPNVTLDAAFAVKTALYNSSECYIELLDNDLPEIALTLTPGVISESAGPMAVMATLKRLTHTDNKVTVKLTDDSNGRLYYSTQTIVLESGVSEAQFTIGAIDNALVDGEQEITVTAAIYISSCDCSASGTTAGVVAQTIKVLDDDGSALRLSSSKSMLLEGADEATVLTITRNTATTNPLAVTLTSDADDLLVHEKAITIPAGKTSVDVVVAAKANATFSDSRTVVFTVKADNYTDGTCWAMITDQTLPDAVVSAVSPASSKIIVGDTVEVGVTVGNEGVATLSAPTKVSLYLNSSDVALATYYTQEDLAPGSTVTITKNVAFPKAVGNYQLRAVVNEAQNTKELLYINNTSEDVPITLLSSFTAKVATDKKIYKQGETVGISGTITGKNTANEEVEVYILNGGVRQTIAVTTDDAGKFSTTWQPYSGQMGHFAVGACYPNEKLSEELASFDIYGLKRTSGGYITCETLVGEPYNGTISLSNPGELPLTGVKVEVLSAPEHCKVSTQLQTEIAGGNNAVLSYTLTNDDITDGEDWEEIKLRVTTSEGVSMDVTLYHFCRSPKGKLQASVSEINTTMIKGASRDYSFTIVNQGKGATGKISLSLPDVAWMKAVTPIEMASLAYGETAIVVLRLTPTEDMQLNVPMTGRIGINCENGDGIPLNYRIESVSESTGTLTIDVCDEYTYYTAEAPHVAGAQVLVKHPVTGVVVAKGLTGEDGKFSVELPEGYYTVSVTADKHDSYKSNILVDPGKEIGLTINLSFKSITIDWTVEETEVEDKYEIVTTIKYETSVPMPVVELNIPQSIPASQLQYGESLLFNAILTNKGLLMAQDVELELPTDVEGYIFEALVEDSINLLPQQSIIIPVKVTKGNSYTAISYSRGMLRSGGEDCYGGLGVLYFWDCGLDRKWHKYEVAINFMGDCDRESLPSIDDNNDNDDNSGGGFNISIPDVYIKPVPHSGTPFDVFGEDYNRNWLYGDGGLVDKGCEPCQNGVLIAGAKCAGHFIGDAVETLQALMGLSAEEESDADNETPSDREVLGACYDLLNGVANAFDACVNASANYDDVHNCYSEISKTIDLMFDEAITGALGGVVSPSTLSKYKSIGKKILKYKKWADILADCGKDFVHACDHINDTSNVTNAVQYNRMSLNSTEDYMGSVLNNLEKVGKQMTAFSYINDIMWGEDPEWDDVSYMEMSILLDSINYREQNFVDIAHYKPEALSVRQFEEFFGRKKAFFLYGMPDSISVKVEENIRIMQETQENFLNQGYSSPAEYTKEHVARLMDLLNEGQSSVCASITLHFTQTMAMTRQAFRGILTVFNGNETTVMEDVKLSLEVRDEYGELATAHEFRINAESLDKFDGELSLDAGWSLAANETGVATILFIPTKYAAPTEAKKYSFGGTLSYIDPYTGLEVTRDLYPVTLTVKPSPNLEMTYFMQRDIFGDDALTTDVVEPMEPAEFSLLINNVGYGDATNVRMVTEQPKIIENEKGLFINFELLSSQLNGGEQALALGGNVATEFGTIPAHGTTYAQWWMQSSLLGHFTEYDIKATHVTSYGNEDLSLLDTVTIHELIRSIKIPVEENKLLTGFLVNDIVDADDLPDMLYLSDGTIENVSVTTNATIRKNSDMEYVLTMAPLQAGWNYGSLIDPTNGMQDIVRIVRQSDGAEINLRNMWQTDRTLRDGKDPLYESRIHFVDKLGTVEEAYLLTFEPKPEEVLEVEDFVGVPTGDEVLTESLTEITVQFNKPIDAATFTTDDLTLNCQGKAQDVSKIVINQVSDTEYRLNLSALSVFNGYYVLTVQTAGIVDNEGFVGETGKTASWIQYIGGKVNLMIEVSPKKAGTVTPAAGLYDYEETVTLTAVPNDGYEFLNWSRGGEVVGTLPSLEYLIEADATIVATFAPKNYDVEIVYNTEEGVVTGGGAGIYQYGDVLNLMAKPASGYVFDAWYVDGDKVATTLAYSHAVNATARVEARFTQVIYDLTLRLEDGWNWVSVNFADDELMTSWKFLTSIRSSVERLVGMERETINDPEYGLVGNLKTLSPTESYKLKVNRLSLTTWSGPIVDVNSTQMALKRGWNWIGYPSNTAAEVGEALSLLKAEEGDYVVGQDGFAQYENNRWIGTLTTLSPGKGYMYHSESDKTFVYSTVEGTSKAKSRSRVYIDEETEIWNVDKYKYPKIMCVVADLYDENRLCTDYLVGAFCGTECRGVGRYVDGKLMMTIYGNGSEKLTFYAVDNDTEEVFKVSEEVVFTETLLGSVKRPYPLYVGNTTGLSKATIGWNVRLESDNLYLSLNGQMFDRVTLTDVYGNVVMDVSDVAQDEAVNIATLPDGVYIVTATQHGVMCYKKIMKVAQ